MSARKRKSSVVKKHVSEPDVPTVEKTVAATSSQDVGSDAEPSIPSKQVKFKESTKVEAPETQPSYNPSTSTGSSKDSDKDSSFSGTTKKDSLGTQHKEKKNIAISSISSDESNPSSVASGENALEIDEDSDGKSSTSDVQAPGTSEKNQQRDSSIFDVGDVTTTSSSSSTKSDDTSSSLTF